MVHSKRYRVMIIGIILICIFAFAGCGNESTPPNQTATASTEPSTSTASTEPAVSPESGLAAWGTTLRLSVPDGAVGVSVTRTVVNHLGQELSAEYDVPCSAAGEVTHTPFGGIFAAPCPDGKPYRADGEITFRIDAPHEVVTLDGHAALRFTGCPILTGMDADDAHEADFAALPMTLYIRNGELSYACGALTAE